MLSEDLPLLSVSQYTPMMKQYMAIKSQYRDFILFYRMGDFYEMFFDDAIEASKILNITLTKRGKTDNQDIPMCGVPYHAYESYLIKLIKHGLKVAICEQVESPSEAKKRGNNAVVKREVVRVITQGTVIEESLLDAESANYLVSIACIDNIYALAWVDLSTCEFYTISSSKDNLGTDINRINPKEILISDQLYEDKYINKTLSDWKRNITNHVKSFFDYGKNLLKVKDFYKVLTLDSFGLQSKAQVVAIGCVLEYLSITQKNRLPNLNFPKIIDNNQLMQIDPASSKSLDLFPYHSPSSRSSLFYNIDKTVTNMGSRLLARYLSAPLIDKEIINKRLDLVSFFCNNYQLTDDIRKSLKSSTDIERSLSRISLGYGGPRDLVAIRNGIITSIELARILASHDFDNQEAYANLFSQLEGYGKFVNVINILLSALKDEVPVLARDGNFIQENFNAKLDQLLEIKNNSNIKLTELKNKYIAETEINSLKISYNNLLGYHIEVTPSNVSKMNSEKFIHRQTLASSVRYSTTELRDLENDIINVKEYVLNLELEIFENLKNQILEIADEIIMAAQSIAIIDVSSSLAFLARENNYVRPIIDNKKEFKIVKGRHPVVENSIDRKNTDEFVPNDCNLSEDQRIWLLTGPNMSGKSTYLRQNAIIAIMAQIGSFVPADFAQIGMVDRVFSRVGAADDLARGRSTYMVEMVETATIINQATEKSLVILDEIGRGTSTYDGVSIAWSCIEYIHNIIKCRTLFATHYHELSELENSLNSLVCYNVAVKEWNNNIIFLHQIEKGAVDKSYGIFVAKLAGLPQSIITRAELILENLENKKQSDVERNNNSTLENNNPKENKLDNFIYKELNSIDCNAISPIEALNLLYKLKKRIDL